MAQSFFRTEQSHGGEVLYPQATAASNWNSRLSVRGMAVSAAMARAAEQAISATASSEMRPVRWTADLSKPTPMLPLRIEVNVLRSGRRLCLVDVAIESESGVSARARGLFAAGGAATVGRPWTPNRELQLPPDDLMPATPEARLYFSEQEGWTSTAGAHQNSTRKQVWHKPIRVVEGEDATVFQTAAGVADIASVVTHWGSGGLAFINADVTLSLARLPTGCELGLVAVERVEADGIAVGTALMYDRDGVIGTSSVCALANADHLVDPRSRDRPVPD